MAILLFGRINFSKESFKIFLPPASEGWGKVMFSVCSHLRGGGSLSQLSPGVGGGSVRQGGVSQPGGWVSVVGWGGWVSQPEGGSVQWGVGGLGQSAGGGGVVSQDRTTEWVLTTRRAVCLLRSRRRTFLLESTVDWTRAIRIRFPENFLNAPDYMPHCSCFFTVVHNSDSHSPVHHSCVYHRCLLRNYYQHHLEQIKVTDNTAKENL